MIGSDGRTRYCGVWGRPPGVGITGQTHRDLFEGDFELNQVNLSDQLLIDMAVSGASRSQSTRERARVDLARAEQKLNDDAEFGRIDVADRDSIREDPAFAESIKAGHHDRRLAAVWTSDSSFEATSIYGLGPAEHLRKCREIITKGYRPVSWSASRTAAEGPLVTASVWHRPTVEEAVKDQLAERQARAAVALVRMGQAKEVWPLLRHSADPRLRSFIVNWLDPLGADPKRIAAELDRLDSLTTRHAPPATRKMDAVLFHPETSTRRALILALGTYGMEGLSSGEREPLTGKLLGLYRDDPDSGIHGAADWTLRRWKQQEKLKELDAELMQAQRTWRPSLVREQPGADLRGDRGTGRVSHGLAVHGAKSHGRHGNATPPDHPPPVRHRRSGGHCRAVAAV